MTNDSFSLGELADLIFVFFDPIGQALCKRTLNLVEQLNIRHPERLRFYLSKADEAGTESDRQRFALSSLFSLFHVFLSCNPYHFFLLKNKGSWCRSFKNCVNDPVLIRRVSICQQSIFPILTRFEHFSISDSNSFHLKRFIWSTARPLREPNRGRL